MTKVRYCGMKARMVFPENWIYIVIHYSKYKELNGTFCYLTNLTNAVTNLS